MPPVSATLLFTAAALTAAPFAVAQEGVPMLGVSLSSLQKSRQVTSLRMAFAAALAAKDAGSSPDALLKNPEYRRVLAAHEVLRVTGDKALGEFFKARPFADEFLVDFLSDREWTEAYLASGRVPTDTPDGLLVLADIWKNERRTPTWGRYHQLSAALGSLWGAGAYREDYRNDHRAGPGGTIDSVSPLWRYKFYRDRHLAGRLHPMFSKLKSWELHYVAGFRCDDASLVWMNDNVNLPLQRYTGACWLPVYRGCTDFGDHVQGPLFYMPWRSVMSFEESVKVHGGVCGSLSTFGAIAAAAHGIPAVTVGQPGHCAYGVRFARGDWRGGFGGPDGSSHLAIWKGNIHRTLITEKVFGDDEGIATALARAARARLYVSRGDIAKAEAEYDAALAASPYHIDLHAEKIALLKSRSDAGYWRRYAESMLPTLGAYGMAGRPLIAAVSEKFLSKNDPEGAFAWFAKENTAYTAARDSWAWDFDTDVLARQAAILGYDPKTKQSGPRDFGIPERLFREALSVQFASEKKPQLGKVVEWGVENMLEQGGGDAFGRAFASAANSAVGKVDDKLMAEAYCKALVGVEKARSIAGFRALGEAASRYADKISPLALQKPAGNLVSDKGALRLSSYSWDRAVNHFNVLNENGGKLHTDREAAPEVIVSLPSSVELSGLLVVKTDDNQNRMKRMKVFRSVDGETWVPLAEVADMPRQWRIECPAGLAARWIKVQSLPDAPEYMHLRNVLVYAK